MRIDLREETLGFISSFNENGERIFQLHFDNHVIILSEEQMESIRE
jgi:hypothetical protein